MTFPGGAGGFNPGNYGLSANGSIPGMEARDQAAVTDQISSEAMEGSSWNGLGGMLIGMILSLIAGGIGAVLNGFGSVLDAIFGTVNDNYVAAMPTINDHTNSITALEAAFDALILQGNATVYTSNNTYTPSDGIVSVEVIIIGAGAGGAAGRWDLVGANRYAGGGGGGGGEVHTVIPAAMFPQTGGHYDPIAITIGAGGSGGVTDAAAGGGGGNTSFGSYLTAGGGQGGWANNIGNSGGGLGGAGMIPGGKGADTPTTGVRGGDSLSAYSLNGGGGGGGPGLYEGADVNTAPQSGGIGGISPGGLPGQPGQAPSSVVATGGGGGGGALTVTSSGGAGAIPAGGGGGGSGSLAGPRGNGGNGARGVLFVIERMN